MLNYSEAADCKTKAEFESKLNVKGNKLKSEFE